MNKLNILKQEYKQLISWGYNKEESAERAINITFRDNPIKPHIYKDRYNDPLFIFYENAVYFFDDEIYIKQS